MPQRPRTLKQMIYNVVVFTAVTLAALYGGLALAAHFVVADRMIFPSPPSSYTDDPGVLKLTTRDGTIISALMLPAPDSNKVLLYSGGNGEDLGRILPMLEGFRRRGISVLAYDYPGYGTSGGQPSESGVYAAAEAAYRHLTEGMGFSPEKIVLYGRSLGSGPSFWLAENFPVAGLVAEGAFASTFRVMPWARFLPGDRFKNLSRLKKIDAPLLLIHGTEDEIIPFDHALLMQKHSRPDTRFLWIEGAGHNNLIEFAESAYWDAVFSFIEGATAT